MLFSDYSIAYFDIKVNTLISKLIVNLCFIQLHRLPFVYLVLDPAVPAAKRKQIIKELRQLCMEELPEYVQPVGYKIIPEMPLTLAAKFDYRKLEEEITPRDY